MYEAAEGGMSMRYRIHYHGYVLVDAEDAQDALDKADNDLEFYEEFEWDYPECVSEEE